MSVNFINQVKIENLTAFVSECLQLPSNHFSKKNKFGCKKFAVYSQNENYHIWFSNLYPISPCGSIDYDDFDLKFNLAFPMWHIDDRNVTTYFRFNMLNIWLKNNPDYRASLIEKILSEKQLIINKFKDNPFKQKEYITQIEQEETYLFGFTLNSLNKRNQINIPQDENSERITQKNFG